jgi:hypothetical protein
MLNMPNFSTPVTKKEGSREMQMKHSNKQPSPLRLTLTEWAQCNHTTRTQHNKRLFLISTRDLMTQLQSYSFELSQSLLLLTRLRLSEIERQNSIAYISQKESPPAQAFLLLPQKYYPSLHSSWISTHLSLIQKLEVPSH